MCSTGVCYSILNAYLYCRMWMVHYDDDDNDDVRDGALQLQLSEFIVPISGIVC